MNTHNAIHLKDIVSRHGPLNAYWLFFPEAMNGVISKFVHGPTHSSSSVMNGMLLYTTQLKMKDRFAKESVSSCPVGFVKL